MLVHLRRNFMHPLREVFCIKETCDVRTRPCFVFETARSNLNIPCSLINVLRLKNVGNKLIHCADKMRSLFNIKAGDNTPLDLKGIRHEAVRIN